MKKKIAAALKEHEIFGKLSEAVLNRVAEKLVSDKVVKEEGDIENAIAGLDLAKVVDSYADNRANEAQVSAVKNYETKHNIKDGKPVNAEDDDPAKKDNDGDGGEDQPSWVKALVESNKKLQERLDAMESEKLITGRKGKLAAAIKDAPEKVRERLMNDYERATFKDEEDFQSWLDYTTAYVAELANIFTPSPKLPTQPKGGGNGGCGETPSAGAKAYAERAAAAATSAISGLPAAPAAPAK